LDFEKVRLDKYVRRKFGKLIPQSLIERALRNKDILVNNTRAFASDKISERDDDVFIHQNIVRSFINFKDNVRRPSYHSEHSNLFQSMVVYEDEDIVIVNKPAGLAVQLGSKIREALDVMARECSPELRLVHRLDKETSGLTILAKNIESSRYMLFLFQHKQVFKKYLAIVSGNLAERSLIVNSPLRRTKERTVVDFDCGQEAITEFEVLKKTRIGGTLVRAAPITGRTHQIRVHLSSIDCPILGDRKYGGGQYEFLCLHSNEVSFTSIRKKKIHIVVDPPSHILSLL
jgi:23S rRNA pseudouridine955/2504/2580 synthase